MMKDNILLAQGGKNKIFIFDAYGKLYKIIDVSRDSPMFNNFFPL